MVFLYSYWLSQDLLVRNKLAGIFNIAKTGQTHVVDNRLQSDGYAVQDVEKGLTPEAIQIYLGSKEKDMDKLWQLLLDRINNPEPQVTSPVTATPPIELSKPTGTKVIKKPNAKKKQK